MTRPRFPRPTRGGFPLVLALLALLVPLAAFASSHSEAPGTAKDRLADDTDFYAYVARDAQDAVTFVANWVPLLEPNGGPNFYSFDDEAFYYITVDNVGDCQDHIRYQFKFSTTVKNGNTFLYNTGVVTSLGDPDLNVVQTYTLTRYVNGSPTVLVSDAPVAPNFVGPVSMPDYTDDLVKPAFRTLGDGTKIFVGPRDDPFFVDLAAIFDLLTIRRVPGDKGGGRDGVGGFNVMSVVLQVPKTQLTKDGQAPSASLNNHIIGCYSSTERLANRTLNADGSASVSGSPIQVSRLGMPLVNEVVIARQDKDKFNATKPTGDGAFLSYVTHPELAVLLKLLYNINTPQTPRNDLVTVFLTGIPGLNQPAGGTACELLRLNMTITPTRNPQRLGILRGDLAGFPNGRRLQDDVVDIAERVVAGATPFTPDFNKSPNSRLGDGVDFNDRPFLSSFPYVAGPHNPLRHGHHAKQSGRDGDRDGDDHDDDDARAGDDRLRTDEIEQNWVDDETSTDSQSSDPAQQVEARLDLAGPNPASSSEVTYTVPQAARVTLKVYDLQGRVVRTIVDVDADAGSFRTRWDGHADDGRHAGKGIYFVRFALDGRVADTRKVVLQ